MYTITCVYNECVQWGKIIIIILNCQLIKLSTIDYIFKSTQTIGTRTINLYQSTIGGVDVGDFWRHWGAATATAAVLYGPKPVMWPSQWCYHTEVRPNKDAATWRRWQRGDSGHNNGGNSNCPRSLRQFLHIFLSTHSMTVTDLFFFFFLFQTHVWWFNSSKSDS